MILPKTRDPRFITIRRGGTLTDADHHLLALWAAACAAHVLPCFEAVRQDDPRPREAIARAFSHLGKRYDFDFDFFSSDKLVCTELVFRCYDGAVKFPLVEVMGRKTLPPTELVRKFVNERGSASAQLECVCFLDGDERTGRASFRPEETFVTTVDRPGLILFPSGSEN